MEDNTCNNCEMEQHLIAVHNSGMNSSNGSPAPTGVVSPNTFVNGFIKHIAPSFKLGVQEDSHEFLRLLIDAMQKSTLLNPNKQESDKRENVVVKQEDMMNIKQEMMDDGGIDDQEALGDLEPPNTNIKIEDLIGSSPQPPSAETIAGKFGNEYPFRLFCGKVESIVKCSNCGASSSTIDPIEDIGLEVNPSASSAYHNGNHSRSTSPLNASTSLTDLTTSLKKFITTEHLDNGYKCEKCGKVGRATKESKLASVPPILTLHLKRFRYGNEKMGLMQAPAVSRRRGPLAGLGVGDVGSSGSAKIEGHVKFNQILDLNPYLTEEQKKQKKRMLCRLFAVIVHSGKNSHSGHYICYVRNIQKNDWWKMDDARVSIVSSAEVFAAEAYMIFYRVVDHPVSIELKNKEKIFKEEEAARVLKFEAERKQIQKVKEEEEERLAKEIEIKSNNEGVLSDQASTIKSVASSTSLKRKRETPELKSGEEWARKLTRKPKAILQTIRAVQEFFSDRVIFKPEYDQSVEEEVENQYGVTGNGSGAGGGLSLGVSIHNDVQNVEDLNGFRHCIWELFKQILPTDPSELEAFLQPKEFAKKTATGGPSSSVGMNGHNTGLNVPKSTTIKEESDLIIPVLDQSDSLI